MQDDLCDNSFRASASGLISSTHSGSPIGISIIMQSNFRYFAQISLILLKVSTSKPDGFEVDTFNNIKEICAKYRKFDCMIIDMPIGLPECVEDMRPDADARKLLSHRSSCIFNTPCRQSVFAGNYPEANELN